MVLPLAGSKSTGSITVAASFLNETRGKVLLSVAPFWDTEFFAIEVPVPEVVLRRSWWVDEPGRQAGRGCGRCNYSTTTSSERETRH